jgi:hypothetical protein
VAQTYPSMVQCRFCGAVPALAATAHGHRGLVLVMQFRSLPGPFCRDCGIAAVRTVSAQTLWQGWWGIASMVVTPVVLLLNLVLRIRLDRLPSPVRPYGSPPPIPAGRPLFQRFAAIGFLVPIVIVAFIAVSVLNDALRR